MIITEVMVCRISERWALTPCDWPGGRFPHRTRRDGDGRFIARPGSTSAMKNGKDGSRGDLSLSRMGARTSGTGLFTADVNGDGRLDLAQGNDLVGLDPFDNRRAASRATGSSIP